TSTKTLMSSTSTSSTSTNLAVTKPKQPKKKAPIKPKILVDEQRKNSVKIQPAVAVPCISPQIFGANPPQAQIASIPMESNVVADTTPTAAAICNSNVQQTFPSTGMLLPSNSQFALASNGNLFSNYGTNFVIRQQPSAASIGSVSGQQQQPQQFVQIMPQQIFFSPVQQQGISSSPTKAVAPTQTPTTANLMTARNLFFHTGNGLFMPISNPNIIGIPQSQQPQQQTFLPITSTNLTPISSAPSKFVVLAAKPSGGTTTNSMPNILPKNSSRGKTSAATATIVSSITTNATATPSLETTISSTPSIQQNSNIMLTNSQNQQLGGENIFYSNSPHHQYLYQVFMAQQKQQQQNLYISNNNSVDVGEKKIELGKGGQQTKPTRVRKKKGSGDTLTADNEIQKHPKIPHFDGTIILQQQQGQQQQGFDEEENEPPPVLCRGGEITSEPPSSGGGTKSIENVFQKEAKIIREKMFDSTGKKYGPLVHDIDGFKIEEDVEPFPCEHQKLLEKLVIDENVINQRKNKNDATTATTN
uniref:GLTSCR protein conserved domain-containing protein n=1 Tax=Meloidogyne floridensis TaxID=298350 RepID=A0A915NS54_9BILA